MMLLKEKQREETVTVLGEIEDEARLFNINVFFCAVIGFLLSRTNVGGSAAPLAVSFMAVLSPLQGCAAFAGSAAAYFMAGTVGLHITELSSMLLMLVIRYSLKFTKRRSSAVKTAVYAGAVYLLCGFAAAVFFRFSLALALAIAFRAALCLIIAYFMYEFLSDLYRNRQICISGEKSISAAVVYILTICALTAVSPGYFSLGRITGAFVLLSLASKRGAAGGAAAGALTALGMLLSSYDMGRSSVLLICAGLLAGIYASSGKLAVSVTFILANLIGSVIIGMPSGSMHLLLDAAAASLLFTFIPDNICGRLIADAMRERSGGPSSEKLKFAADALNDVKSTVTKASKALETRASGGLAALDTAVDYLSAAEGALVSLRQTNDFPYCDSIKAAAVEKALSAQGARSVSACVYYDTEEHIFIECYYEKKLLADMKAVVKKLSQIADRELDAPHITESNGKTRLCLHEIPPLTLDIGQAGKAGIEFNISGDTADYFSDGMGRMFFILSDGMGMGSRAAVESRMTVSLLSRLLKAGIEAAASVKLTNLLLAAKSSDEIFATVDLAELNLFSGKTDIIKLGASVSFIKTKGLIKTVECGSLPAGILSAAEFDSRSLMLKNGGCIVMLTDGIGENCVPKIKELMLTDGINAQYTADEIFKYACANDAERPDDKTVLAVKIC